MLMLNVKHNRLYIKEPIDNHSANAYKKRET